MSLWSDAIGYGVHADRPAAGRPGAVYFESDTGNGYRDNGTGWDRVVGAPRFALQMMSAGNIVIAQGNTLILNSGNGHSATLPAAADCVGELIAIVNTGAGSSTLATVGGETFQNGSSVTWLTGDNSNSTGNFGCTVVMSDGTRFNILAHMNGL